MPAIIIPIVGVLLLTAIVLSILGLILSLLLKNSKSISDMHLEMDFMHDNTVRFMSSINNLIYTHTMVSHDINFINKSINNMASNINSIKGLNSIIDNLETIRNSTQEVVEAAIETIDTVVGTLEIMPGQGLINITGLLKGVSDSLRGTIPDPDDTGVFDNREEEVEEQKEDSL